MDANWLKDERATACAVLEAAGIQLPAIEGSEPLPLAVHESNPEYPVPPAAVLVWGAPQLCDGDTFGTVKLRFTFQLSVPSAANDRATDDLDTLISSSAAAFLSGGYGIEQVGQPYMLAVQNAQYLTADMTLAYEASTD
jgi:hypothetical protein